VFVIYFKLFVTSKLFVVEEEEKWFIAYSS